VDNAKVVEDVEQCADYQTDTKIELVFVYHLAGVVIKVSAKAFMVIKDMFFLHSSKVIIFKAR
jgi:hypothetical protein